jgi:hypothetical protein
MILQINFNLNVPVAEYQKMADSVAHAFLDVPGLRWKIWLLNPAAQEAGGIYLFDSQASLDAYLNGPLVAQIHFDEAVRSHAGGYGIDPRPLRSGIDVRRIANRQRNGVTLHAPSITMSCSLGLIRGLRTNRNLARADPDSGLWVFYITAVAGRGPRRPPLPECDPGSL